MNRRQRVMTTVPPPSLDPCDVALPATQQPLFDSVKLEPQSQLDLEGVPVQGPPPPKRRR